MFFVQAAGKNGKVITFEPNPQNYKWILEHLKLNNLANVDVYQVAIGREADTMALVFQKSQTGTGSLREDIKTSILRSRDAKTILVRVDSLDSQIVTNNLPKPDFVKIDVEGLEMDVLQGMVKTIEGCKPNLFVEIHGVDVQRKIQNVQRVVDILIAGGYSIYSVESGEIITSLNAQIAKEGHLYCA